MSKSQHHPRERDDEDQMMSDDGEDNNPSLLDPLLQDHILSICTALGGLEVDESTGKESYALGDECLGKARVALALLTLPWYTHLLSPALLYFIDCLKDLKRFLREDDQIPDKPLLRTLGQWQVVQTDLLPIFLLNAPCQSKEQSWLAGACGRCPVHVPRDRGREDH